MSRRFPFYTENVPSELKHRRQFVNWKAIEKPHATQEAEISALAAVYKLVLCGSQASKGGPNDLIGTSAKECTRPDQKGKEDADLHGHGQ